uniref:Uncharacterized protein n=1 Tax=Physcomitrium patens TaxID=3218 RepID=A0A2K1IHB4_PHYPA|nr:hypothetical protein PHYPA_029251 [Physcomitrium patens]
MVATLPKTQHSVMFEGNLFRRRNSCSKFYWTSTLLTLGFLGLPLSFPLQAQPSSTCPIF